MDVPQTDLPGQAFTALAARLATFRRKGHKATDLELRCRIDIKAPKSRSWYLDISAPNPVRELAAHEQPAIPPEVTMTYDSEDTFFAVQSDPKGFAKAIMTQKVKLQGNLAKLTSLKNVMEEVMKGDGDGAPGLNTVPKSRWEPDGPSCTMCGVRFGVVTRRHHCRFCGALACAQCTSCRLEAHRSCKGCFTAARRPSLRKSIMDRASEASAITPAAATTPMPFSNNGKDPLRERLRNLESKLMMIEQQRREATATSLLRCVQVVILSVVISTLAFGCVLGVLSYREAQQRDVDAWARSAMAPLMEWLQKVLGSQLTSALPCITASMMLSAIGPLLSLGMLLRLEFRRSLCAFSVTAVLLVAIELTKMKARRALKKGQDQIWNEANGVFATHLRLSFFQLKGMYLKLGQYISSRADIVPDEYCEELSALQDAVPPSPMSLVRPLIERAIKCRLSEMFESVDDQALASASVAQVHRAKLRNGKDVVIKVQHPDVARLLAIDLRNIVQIFSFIGWWSPDFDFSIVAKEWATEVAKELNFTTEGINVQKAHDGLKKSGLDVVVPESVFSSPELLIMTFCEGVKVTGPAAFPGDNQDEVKAQYMRLVCEAFAYGMYVQGVFNCDPHPGNLLVQTVGDDVAGKRRVRPVLLDWGMTKILSENLRLGNAMIVWSAYNVDVAGMLDGMAECGMHIDKVDIFRDLANMSFLMRNTSPSDEARAAAKKFVEVFTEAQKKKAVGTRNPLAAVGDATELLFLARVAELLQGLASRLGTRVEYMEVMGAYCKKALIERRRLSLPPSVRGGRVKALPAPLSSLDRKVRALLGELVSEGAAMGCQVVVLKNGRMLVNACVGTRGILDPEPVTPSTLFCGFSLCKMLLSFLAHALVDQGLLSYDTLLSSVWPQLASRGDLKSSITLRHLLSHKTGLHYAFPKDPSPLKLWDRSEGEAAVLETKPVHAPGARASYHMFSYGWLLVPVLEQAAGKPLADIFREHVLSRLQPRSQSEMVLGALPVEMLDKAEVATVEYDLRSMVASHMENGGNVGAAGAGLLAMLGSTDESSSNEPEAKALTELLGVKLKGREFLLDPRMLNAQRLKTRADAGLASLNGRFSARALADLFDVLCRFERSSGLVATPVHRRNSSASFDAAQPYISGDKRATPRVNGVSRGFAAPIKGSNGNKQRHGAETPTSLSSSSLSSAGDLDPILSLERLRALRSCCFEEEPNMFVRMLGRESAITLGLGVQLFGFNIDGASRFTAYGHAAACGQLALCDPATGVSVVVMGNKAPLPGGKNVGFEVLKLISAELGLGSPMPIW